MSNISSRLSTACRSVAAVAGLAAAFILAGPPNVAMAHSFTVSLEARAADRPGQLVSAIRGMRLAAGERDSHAAETSDGHLGGIDLLIRVRPPQAADGITWLKGAPDGPATVVVDFSTSDSAPARVAADGAVVIGPGILPADAVWAAVATARPDGFVARYRAAYGTAPDRQAAQGYNAARRIDRALRDQGDAADSQGLRQALDRSAGGIDWD